VEIAGEIMMVDGQNGQPVDSMVEGPKVSEGQVAESLAMWGHWQSWIVE
jgi:hypothetical protein